MYLSTRVAVFRLRVRRGVDPMTAHGGVNPPSSSRATTNNDASPAVRSPVVAVKKDPWVHATRRLHPPDVEAVGDAALTPSVTTPPQVSRHRGHETASAETGTTTVEG
ncbi:hypothetical protein BRD18_04865 [Halobacteriales archaeon SW_7_71_33]|nr:MAG: hypothetical protein BRD18_04865 [Halobacteriales archaeon SW_7_71_33]